MIRNMTDAALMAPDGSLEKSYFTEKVNNTLVAWQERYIVNGDYPTVHCFDDGNPVSGEFVPEVVRIASPWEDDFVLIVLAHMRDVGFNAQALLDWQGDTVIQRFANPAMNPYRGPCYHMATMYKDSNGEVHRYATWEAVNAAWLSQPGPDHFDNVGNDSYTAIVRAAMSYVLHLPGGTDLWNWYDAVLPGKEIFDTSPGWDIVPIGYVPPADVTQPAPPYNLHVSDATGNSLKVSWTAPGDDNLSGTASSLRSALLHEPDHYVELGQRHTGRRGTHPGDGGIRPVDSCVRPGRQHDLLLRHEGFGRGTAHV